LAKLVSLILGGEKSKVQYIEENLSTQGKFTKVVKGHRNVGG